MYGPHLEVVYTKVAIWVVCLELLLGSYLSLCHSYCITCSRTSYRVANTGTRSSSIAMLSHSDLILCQTLLGLTQLTILAGLLVSYHQLFELSLILETRGSSSSMQPPLLVEEITGPVHAFGLEEIHHQLQCLCHLQLAQKRNHLIESALNRAWHLR